MTSPPTSKALRPFVRTEPGVLDGETPNERVPLWALVDQVKDVSGEIALAVDMLDSEDPEEARTAIDLLNQFVDIEHDSKKVVFEKADKIAHYIAALRRQAEARRQAAEEDHERALKRAARDERRAEHLLSYLQTQLRRLEPDAKRFELPSYDLASRAGSIGTVVDDASALPEEFLVTPPPAEPKPRPDLRAIKAAIQSGREVPGARLVQHERTWSLK